MAWVMNVLEASSWPDCSVASSDASLKISRRTGGAGRAAEDLVYRTGRQVVVRLGQLEHVDEVPALRVDIGVRATEFEARLLHQGEEAAQRLLAAGYGSELAGVFALRVVGDHDRRAGVLHVPVRELWLEGRDVIAADALEYVRADLAGGDVALEVARSTAPAREGIAVGLREGRANDLLVEVLERGGDTQRSRSPTAWPR